MVIVVIIIMRKTDSRDEDTITNLSVNSDDDVSTLPQQTAFNETKHGTYDPFTAFCFTVNYILGVGVLGMPHGFVKAGWFMSMITLFLITCFSWVTGMWMVQVQDRARAALFHTHHSNPSLEANTPSNIAHAHEELVEHEHGLLDAPFLDNHQENPTLPHLWMRRLEVNELIGLFCGPRFQRAYEICLSILIVGALWAYSAVFAGSMAVHVSIPFLMRDGEPCTDESQLNGACQSMYFFWLGIFGLIVVPLTCRELTEMKIVMIALALFRFVSLTLMMLTSVVALYKYPSAELAEWTKENNSSYEPSTSAPYYSDMAAVVLSGIGVIFPIAVSSQLFHHSIPNLSYPLRPREKSPQVFTAVLLTTYSLYTALGLCVGLFYGSSIPSTCTLIWVKYTGQPGDSPESRSVIATIISYVIVLFPPIDVLSAFPLNGITFGNNLLTACVSPAKAVQRKYIVAFRLIAALAPLLGAMAVKDLGIILQYTGCVGVAVAFFFPAALSFYSKRHEKAEAVLGHDAEALESRIISGKFASLLDHWLTLSTVSAFAITGLIASIVLSIVNAT